MSWEDLPSQNWISSTWNLDKQRFPTLNILTHFVSLIIFITQHNATLNTLEKLVSKYNHQWKISTSKVVIYEYISAFQEDSPLKIYRYRLSLELLDCILDFICSDQITANVAYGYYHHKEHGLMPKVTRLVRIFIYICYFRTTPFHIHCKLNLLTHRFQRRSWLSKFNSIVSRLVTR